jgi:hypothetical protein
MELWLGTEKGFHFLKLRWRFRPYSRDKMMNKKNSAFSIMIGSLQGMKGLEVVKIL